MDELRSALEKAGCYISDEDLAEILNEFELKAGNGMNFDEFKEVMMCFTEEVPEMQASLEGEHSRDKERRSTRRLSQKRLTTRRNTLRRIEDVQIV